MDSYSVTPPQFLYALIQDGLIIAESLFAIDLHALGDFQYIFAESFKQRELQHRAEHGCASAFPDTILLGVQSRGELRRGLQVSVVHRLQILVLEAVFVIACRQVVAGQQHAAVLLGEQEQVRCRMGGAVRCEIAFFHHEYPGEICGKVTDFIITGGVHMLCIGKVFPFLCLVLFGIVEMSGQNFHKRI